MRVTVVGAGVAGLACALELAERGAEVEVLERCAGLEAAGCSWFAGGMLAPWCELESSPPLIAELGAEAPGWWRERFAGTTVNGTLLLAHDRDAPELRQFGSRTRGFEALGAPQIAALEPELSERFGRALYFREEGHLDPRAALAALLERLRSLGVTVRFGVEVGSGMLAGRAVLDCTGLAARTALPELRGVKGEMLLLRQGEISLARPVRVLHPRLPVYVVPRAAGVFMVGASMLESDAPGRISARSTARVAIGRLRIASGVRRSRSPRDRQRGARRLSGQPAAAHPPRRRAVRQRPVPSRLSARAGARTPRRAGAARGQAFCGGDG